LGADEFQSMKILMNRLIKGLGWQRLFAMGAEREIPLGSLLFNR
jgi:hypothetical protein